MTTREKLTWLTDRYEGVGIPLSVIARYVGCDPSTLGRYVNIGMTPNKKNAYMLE